MEQCLEKRLLWAPYHRGKRGQARGLKSKALDSDLRGAARKNLETKCD